jgi:2-octaprenyl-6-methoxyphenol hydroxylase
VALSYGSRLIFERLGAWDRLSPATAIRHIHVSQRSGFGRAMLNAQDADLPELGYVVDYPRMHAVLNGLLADRRCRLIHAMVTKITPGHDSACVEYAWGDTTATIRAQLVVVADGGATHDGLRTRVVDYGQTAVVATVASAKPHRNTAFERFTAAGPLALLPYGDRYAVVWSVSPGRARELVEAPDAAFAGMLEQDFGGRLGEFGDVAQRAAFRLMLRVSGDAGSPHVVRVGNAAQMLHPVAGQGLNLGLRDAWELGVELGCDAQRDAGNATTLLAYRARRRIDRYAGIGFTHALVRGFSNDLQPLRAARGLGLTLLGCAPPARDFLARRMTFGFHA